MGEIDVEAAKDAGSKLFQKLVDSEAIETLSMIVNSFGKGTLPSDAPGSVWVCGSRIQIAGEQTEVHVVIPHYKEGGFDPNEYSYVMDLMTHELIIQTEAGWRRTGFIIRFD